MAQEDMEQLLEQSASTDIKVLLAAKENAKKAVLEDPSPTNLAAFERASKLVENAKLATANFKDYRAVLAHADEWGRKVKKSKLFDDIKAARLKRQPDGSFRLRDVDRYFASLPMAGTSDAVAEKAADRRRRKEEEEIRRLKAGADKDEFALAREMGKYIPKERVHLELAARAVALAAGIKNAFEVKNLEIIEAVDGNPKKSSSLVDLLEKIFDEAFNIYSREMDFTVEFEDIESTGDETGASQNAN